MTTDAGSGHVECIGRTWYLRRREIVTGETGKPRLRQHRVRLGSTRQIRSRAAARKIADGWLARLAAPTLDPGLATTFRAYSERFIHDHVALLRASSKRRYTSSIRILQASIGDELLSAIDTPRLQTAITELAANRAPATVRTLRTIALQILRRARVDKFAAHAIDAKDIRLPRTSKPAAERQSWTQAQLEQLIAASAPPWSTLWGLMGYAGLRAGEALALTWSDVDLEARTLRIRGNVTRAGVQAPKTAKSAAVVPLLPRAAALLVEYRDVWPTNATGLLFATRTGRCLSADDVRARKLHPLLTRLGLPRAGLHSFRHSTLAILDALGLTFDAVRLFMRHSTLAMTQRYLHSDAADLRRQVDAATSRAGLQTSAMGTSL